MEALLALLTWLNLGSWISPTPTAPPAASLDSTSWAGTEEMLPGLPPPKP